MQISKKKDEDGKIPEDRYEFLINNIQDVIVELDLRLSITYINPKIYNISGYRPEELIGKNMYEFIHPEDRQHLKDLVEESIKKREETASEFRLHHKDNHYIWVSMTGTMAKSGDKLIPMAVLRDITEKRKIEQELREYVEKYNNIITNIPDVVLEIDMEGRYTYVSPQILDITGNTPEWLMGKKWHIFAADRKEKLKELLDLTNPEAETSGISFEFKTHHADQSDIWFEVKGKRFVDKHGEKKDILIARDVTEKKKSDQQLREYVEKYDNIIKYTSDIIAEVDMKGVFTYISPQVYEVTGIQPKSFIGKTWYSFAKSDVSEVKKTLHPSKNIDEVIFDFKTVNAHTGNDIWLEVKGKRFQDKGGEQKDLIIVRDITEKKKSEETLKKALEKENFYKNLFTHDINNILHIIQTSISLFTLFQNDPKKHFELNNLVNLMKEQVVRGTMLVSNVRRLSDLESHEFTLQSMDVCDVLRNAIKFVREGFQNTKIDIEVNFDGALFFVEANELLTNIFENILINAAKYNDNPISEILISISTIKIDDIDHIKVEFIDNGIGIPDSKKDIIFQEGHKKDKGGKGMGFGLSLVRKIVESYNGKVWVENNIEGDHTKGSNFIVLIPKQYYCKYK